MIQQLLVAGGGMGGLAAAIAAAQAGWQPQLFEQAAAFSEAGAGLQLGPNATRRLQAWGLGEELEQAGAFPLALRVRSASDAKQLACMALGKPFVLRYGAPYVTLHRADLHRILRVRAEALGARLNLDARITWASEAGEGVVLDTSSSLRVEGTALAAADGLWSTVRTQLWPGSAAPLAIGHLAYRALLKQQDLPARLRSDDVTVWLGPRLHAVTYPVRRGEWLNAVVIVEGESQGSAQNWDLPAVAADLLRSLEAASACSELKDLVSAAPWWRSWVLHDRAPVAAPGDMARGRIALIGDAAHPMRPYLAQGAGMAIEDADEFGRCLSLAREGTLQVPAALSLYAANRWARNARVQRRSLRNGRIFHATGPMRLGRDVALKVLGERLLDSEWLYG
ncbi:MAG TPA: FAD-dependent monooxygenase [Ramlibacter sp.]|nr:FAD-dependent monooxygenase [Ramlibacter sp.]